MPATDDIQGIAVRAVDVAPRRRQLLYPDAFADRMRGRTKHALGDVFGLRNFGVNLTRLMPGAISALRHVHAVQDEFIYVLEGSPTLITDGDETVLGPGACAGFPARGTSHQLVNRSATEVVYLECGDRTVGDRVSYPDDDMLAALGDDGVWAFTHADGRPY
jgi:uncharacterized cupin superfamily protein